MDGENNGNTPIQNGMIWRENPPFKETPISACGNPQFGVRFGTFRSFSANWEPSLHHDRFEVFCQVLAPQDAAASAVP